MKNCKNKGKRGIDKPTTTIVAPHTVMERRFIIKNCIIPSDSNREKLNQINDKF